MESARIALRFGYLPLVLLGWNGLGMLVVERGASKAWLPMLLVLAIGLSFVAERILPYEADWNRAHGDGLRDTLHAAVNEAANFSTLLLLPIFTSLLAIEGVWPSQLPFIVQVLLSILVLDVGITLAHLASHRVQVLWRFHAVHHSVKRMYGFNGLMKHPLHQALETVSGTTPLILIGLPTDVATALVFAVAVQLLLQHSNVDYWVGPLRYVLAVNEVHRFHHQQDPELGDVNFGLFTTLWDQLLGTFHFEEREPFVSDDLGIGAEPDYPADYWRQLVQPFRAKRTSDYESPA